MGKAKGSTLDGAVRFLRLDRAEAERQLPEELRHYLDDEIAISSWYPESDLLGLIQAIVAMLPGERDAVLAEMGRITVREHLEGAYAHLIEGGDGRNLSIRAQSLWASMHDTGKLKATEQEPGRIRLSLSGYALPSEELCAITRGYMQGILSLNGLDARVVKLQCAARGDTSCLWDMHWDVDADHPRDLA